MARKRKNDQETFLLYGRIDLEECNESIPEDLQLTAYAFNRTGQLIAREAVNEEGEYRLRLEINKPVDLHLYVGPAGDPQQIRRSTAYSRLIPAENWRDNVLERDLFFPRAIWWPWRPQRVCITGHVRKLVQTDENNEKCPVPFAKVEIFDVDREACLLHPLLKWKDLLVQQPVVRLPELMKEPPIIRDPRPQPRPQPDPVPFRRLERRIPTDRLEELAADVDQAALSAASAMQPISAPASQAIAQLAQLDYLTVTSKIAPWLVFPHCFYSKELICTTYTDECGYFRCCFNWWPFHIRRGRLRYDRRPDIILRVTQVINGVEKVIYLDPYSNTRWNVSHAHIDLCLDDEEIICGSCDDQDRPAGTQVFFTRIGDDEVYQINQSTGLYNDLAVQNVAYGHTLNIYAQFGDTLSRAQNMTGATPPYYYRLSHSTDGNNFDWLTDTLVDTRVNKSTLLGDSHKLGPYEVNGTPALYELRNFGTHLWYNPDLIGRWRTHVDEADTDKYTLRLEVFDSTGTKLTSSLIDYRDGTAAPPSVLPSMTDRCDLVLTIDNVAPDINLTIPAVLNACGVIKWSPSLTLNFHVNVSQANGRLYRWGLNYSKGVSGTDVALAGATFANGSPGFDTAVVSGAPLLSGLTSTCAFALELWARPHIRNGRTMIYRVETDQAIAIEKCG